MSDNIIKSNAEKPREEMTAAEVMEETHKKALAMTALEAFSLMNKICRSSLCSACPIREACVYDSDLGKIDEIRLVYALAAYKEEQDAN